MMGESNAFFEHLPGLEAAGYAVNKTEEYLFIVGGHIEADDGWYMKDAITVYDIKKNEMVPYASNMYV